MSLKPLRNGEANIMATLGSDRLAVHARRTKAGLKLGMTVKELEAYMMDGDVVVAAVDDRSDTLVGGNNQDNRVALTAHLIPQVPANLATTFPRHDAATTVPLMKSRMPQSRFVLCEDDDDDVSGGVVGDNVHAVAQRRKPEASQELFF